MIKKYKQFNEGITQYLKGPSKDEIIANYGSIDNFFKIGLDKGRIDILDTAVKYGIVLSKDLLEDIVKSGLDNNKVEFLNFSIKNGLVLNNELLKSILRKGIINRIKTFIDFATKHNVVLSDNYLKELLIYAYKNKRDDITNFVFEQGLELNKDDLELLISSYKNTKNINIIKKLIENNPIKIDSESERFIYAYINNDKVVMEDAIENGADIILIKDILKFLDKRNISKYILKSKLNIFNLGNDLLYFVSKEEALNSLGFNSFLNSPVDFLNHVINKSIIENKNESILYNYNRNVLFEVKDNLIIVDEVIFNILKYIYNKKQSICINYINTLFESILNKNDIKIIIRK